MRHSSQYLSRWSLAIEKESEHFIVDALVFWYQDPSLPIVDDDQLKS